MKRSLRPSAVLGATLLAACGDFSAPCESHADCRDAFGFGWTCENDGRCAQEPVHPRCATTVPPDLFDHRADYTDHVVLGAMFDASYDINEGHAIELAITQANDEGGIGEGDVGLVECTYETNPDLDDLDFPGAVAEVALWLNERMGIEAIIGAQTSSTTQDLFNTLVENEPFIMTPSATSPALTYLDGVDKTDENPGTLWRTAPPDSLQGQAAAADMTARGVTKVGLVWQNGAYGDGLSEIFQARWTGGLVLVEFDDENQRDEAIARVQLDDTLEEVFFISSEAQDAASLVNAAASTGFFGSGPGGDDKRIFLADGASSESLIDETTTSKQVYRLIRGTRPSVDTTSLSYTTFQVSYVDRFDVDPSSSIYTAYSYDATWLTMYAAIWARAEGADGPLATEMGRAMRSLSDRGTSRVVNVRPSSWNDLKGWFGARQTIDVIGVSGPLDYDPDTEETSAPIEVWGIDPAEGFVVYDVVSP